MNLSFKEQKIRGYAPKITLSFEISGGLETDKENLHFDNQS